MYARDGWAVGNGNGSRRGTAHVIREKKKKNKGRVQTPITTFTYLYLNLNERHVF